MSIGGTAAYRGLAGLPSLVAASVAAAERSGFEQCVRPEIGRLLAALAGGLGRDALVGETGTGTGTGLAWMASTAPPGTRFVSIERDAGRATTAGELFLGLDAVEIVHGDAGTIVDHGPFDLLVLDGGPGSGKAGDTPLDPAVALRPAGTITIDDFTPTVTWPPRFGDDIDRARLHWLDHPGLRATEIRVAPDLAVVVGRRLPDETPR